MAFAAPQGLLVFDVLKVQGGKLFGGLHRLVNRIDYMDNPNVLWQNLKRYPTYLITLGLRHVHLYLRCSTEHWGWLVYILHKTEVQRVENSETVSKVQEYFIIKLS